MKYADDSEIYLSHRESLVIKEELNRDLKNTKKWFQENGLIIKTKKIYKN